MHPSQIWILKRGAADAADNCVESPDFWDANHANLKRIKSGSITDVVVISGFSGPAIAELPTIRRDSEIERPLKPLMGADAADDYVENPHLGTRI